MKRDLIISVIKKVSDDNGKSFEISKLFTSSKNYKIAKSKIAQLFMSSNKFKIDKILVAFIIP